MTHKHKTDAFQKILEKFLLFNNTRLALLKFLKSRISNILWKLKAVYLVYIIHINYIDHEGNDNYHNVHLNNWNKNEKLDYITQT